ncbi:hypothetical protein SODALDRAFT_357817 [Sodiomyces alkalinus F11]|uniref:Uncharacterized protein n=1 Tax=Sodiomyces alkalinus (strain CBS 110278 / VKM F-3762 / F11) TaxID=1314773 RepID=A0A3N2Q534_SODAK|nr:hypothetical protein SODALDRAFT_357817 [Sodiomyces alkalinus F11]ROT41735.1 hypothetical protein SODALDRAFT_357817 [Sodiomyces alkalinus F11]
MAGRLLATTNHNMSLDVDFYRPDPFLSRTYPPSQAVSDVQDNAHVPLFLRLALPPITVVLDGSMSQHQSGTSTSTSTSTSTTPVPSQRRAAPPLDKSPVSQGKPDPPTAAQAPVRTWPGRGGPFATKYACTALPPRYMDGPCSSSITARNDKYNPARFSHVTCTVTPVLEVDDEAADGKAEAEAEAAMKDRIAQWRRRRRQRNVVLQYKRAIVRRRGQVPEDVGSGGIPGQKKSDRKGDTALPDGSPTPSSAKSGAAPVMTADPNPYHHHHHRHHRHDVDEGFCEESEDAHPMLPSLEEIYQATGASRSRYPALPRHRDRVLEDRSTTEEKAGSRPWMRCTIGLNESGGTGSFQRRAKQSDISQRHFTATLMGISIP